MMRNNNPFQQLLAHRRMLFGIAFAFGFSALYGLSGYAHQTEGSTPKARAHHQLAYDAAQDRIYLIGGSTPAEAGHIYFDDIWAWEDGRWMSVGNLPFRRSSHRVVFHAGRESLMLFGGTDEKGVDASGTLWEGENDVWSALDASSEAAAAEPGVCYDRERDRLVVYGGADSEGNFTSTTWEWDQADFVKITDEGPGARLGHVLFWDPASRACGLFGGRDSSGSVHGDTWILKEGAWRKLDVAGPPARWIHTATADEARSRAIIFGGQDAEGQLLGDTWSWDGVRWSLISDGGPAPRMMGQMTAGAAGVVLFGGRAAATEGDRLYQDQGDTWLLGNAGWEKLQD